MSSEHSHLSINTGASTMATLNEWKTTGDLQDNQGRCSRSPLCSFACAVALSLSLSLSLVLLTSCTNNALTSTTCTYPNSTNVNRSGSSFHEPSVCRQHEQHRCPLDHCTDHYPFRYHRHGSTPTHRSTTTTTTTTVCGHTPPAKYGRLPYDNEQRLPPSTTTTTTTTAAAATAASPAPLVPPYQTPVTVNPARSTNNAVRVQCFDTPY